MSNNDLERAKKLLKIVDIIELYNYYLIRRSIGMIYIIIIALVTMIMLLCSFLTESLSLSLSVVGALYVVSFIVFMVIIILLSTTIVRIPTIYETKSLEGKRYGIVWTIIGIIIIISSIIIYNTSIPDYYFPFTMQFLYGIAYVCNYFISKMTGYYPGKVDVEYLYLGVSLIAGSMIILIYPRYDWIVVVLFAFMGTFLFGIYLIITASNIFKEREEENESGSTEETSSFIEGG